MVAGRYVQMGFWHESECIDVKDPLEDMGHFESEFRVARWVKRVYFD